MAVAPDLLLQTISDLKLKATPAKASSRSDKPSNDEASSFAKVYARERREPAGEPARAKPASHERAAEGREAPADPAVADGSDEVAIAEGGNALPADGETAVIDGDQVESEESGEEAALLFALLPGGALPEQAKGRAVGLTGELPQTAAEPAQLHAAAQGAPAAKASGSASAAPATLTEASSDPQIEALNSLAALQLDLQGETAAKPAVTPPGQAAQGAATTQPAALFGQAMAALQAQTEGQAAEGENAESGLLEVSASILENSAGNKLQAQPESFAGRLNALAQAITQQTGRSPSLLVPGQPLALQQGGMSESLVDKVMWLSSQNLKSAEIQLDPAELGRLEVRIELTKDQAAQVTFASPNAAVREALEAQQHRLRELFAQQGMGQLDVNVSDQSLNRGWQGQQAEEGGHGSARHDAEGGQGNEPMIAQGQLEVGSRLAGAGAGLVDFYA